MRRLSVLAAAATLAACNPAADMDAAEAQIASFHRAYNAGNYGLLWERASPAMKNSASKEQFLVLMAMFTTHLGAVQSSTRTGFHVNYTPGGSQVTLTYRTLGANGEAIETFVYDTADPPRLLGWRFTVPHLLTPPPAPVEILVTPSPQPPG